MKTVNYPVPKKGLALSSSFLFALLLVLFTSSLCAQSITFSRYARSRGNVGKKGAEYLFQGVYLDAKGKPLADCIVRIESLSAGTTVKYINQNTGSQSFVLPGIEFGSSNTMDSIELSFRFIPHGQDFDWNGSYSFPFLAVALSNEDLSNAIPFFEYDMGAKSKLIYGWKGMKTRMEKNGPVYKACLNPSGLVRNVSNNASEETVAVYSESVNRFRIKMGIRKRFPKDIIYANFRIDLNPINGEINTIKKPMVFDFAASKEREKAALSCMIGDYASIASIDIEKSEDGQTFTKIARVRQAQLPLDGERFQYMVSSAPANSLINGYYRMRVVAKDGKEQFTKTVAVVNPQGKKKVEAWISFQQEESKLILSTPPSWRNTKVDINVFNETGELVKQVTEQFPGVGIDIMLNDLPKGMYYIHAETAGEYSLTSYLYTGSL